MKILHIVPSYKPAYIYGGTIESIARLCESLVQIGEDVQVFTTTANGKEELNVQLEKEYIVDGVKVIYFKRNTKDPTHVSFSLWNRLYKDCKKYDAVHIHSWWNVLVIVSALICKMRKIKTVFSPRGMLSDYILWNSNARAKNFIHTSIGKFLLKSMILHATSEAELIECRRLIPNWKGFVISNIIWLPEVTIHKNPHPKFTILFLSRIHPKKGIELLMEAISKLNNDVCLKIAGSGNEQYIEQLKKKANELGIEHKTKWLGWKNRTEKFETLVQADLFALISYNENFANVVVEALHVGTPVLLSDKVGVSDFVQKNNLGWITTLETKEITQQLETAIADKNQCSKISGLAPMMVKKNFSTEVLIPQYIQLYLS